MTSVRGPLMVIIPDRLSDLVDKGEVTSRYYNPGNLFDEVHLVLTNDDQPDLGRLQPMVGDARLHVHNLPDVRRPGFIAGTLFWRPWLLRRWTSEAVALAARVRPALVRCHGPYLNSFAAAAIRRQLGIPFLVSLHINPDLDLRRPPEGRPTLRRRVGFAAVRGVERRSLQTADCVVCVYRFIEPFARASGARRVEVLYNVVNTDHLVPKSDYSLHEPPRVIVPGRQFAQKDQRPIVEALVELPGVEATFVGDGALHEEMIALAERLGVADRTIFHRAISNDELCAMLRSFDLLVSVNDYGGISKVELEAAHVGMPIVTNAHPFEVVPEVLGTHCVVVDGGPDAYAAAIRSLLEDDDRRERLGVEVREAVQELTPGRMEHAYVELYLELLGEG